MAALKFWMALMVIQMPSSTQPFVETAMFGSHDICEEFTRLSKPALREGAKPIVCKCIPVDISKDVLTDSLSKGLKK